MKVNSRFLNEFKEASSLPGALPSLEKPFNVCGLLAHISQEKKGDVMAMLNGFDGVDVHAETEDGRLVITIEDTPELLATERITQIDRLDGVLNSSLVYHQFENHDTLEMEEVSS